MMKRLLPLGTLCAAAAVLAGCGAVGHIPITAGSPTVGETLFSDHCAACHTLANDPTAIGTIGPNLDYAFGPDRCQGFSTSVIEQVVYGQINYADPDPATDWPPGTDNPVQGMPPNLVTGQDAKDVAVYVATVAGLTHGPGKYFDCQTGAYAG